jgi:hypothetical protein
MYFILKISTVLDFYFFVLTQKSNLPAGQAGKKGQSRHRAGGKRTKNFEISLNPANSPPVSFALQILPAQTTPAFYGLFQNFLNPEFIGTGCHFSGANDAAPLRTSTQSNNYFPIHFLKSMTFSLLTNASLSTAGLRESIKRLPK